MFPSGKRTLKSLLRRSCVLYHDRPALSLLDNAPVIYEELGRRVSLLSHDLLRHGITAGQRVAILSENKPNWGIAFFAITITGAVAVPVLPDFHGNEVDYILRHAGVKALFVSEKQVQKVSKDILASLSAAYLIDDFSRFPSDPEKPLPKEDSQSIGPELSEIIRSGEKAPELPDYEPQETDPASIIYTSGTTGLSKGVILTHLNLIFDATATLQIQPVHREDRLISILPLSHSYECTIGFLIPLMRGACITYLDKPPVPGVLLPAMAKVKPTMMMTVPLIIEKIYKKQVLPQLTSSGLRRILMKTRLFRTIMHRVAASKIYKLFGGKLRFYGIGGALLSADVERFLREGKFPYAIGYGLTETAPLIAGCSPDKTRYRSTGYAIPGVEIRIHQPLSETGEGEIQVRGQNVMQGYYMDAEKTREVITEDGWFRTGDLGFIDDDGYLYIRGRLKNLILGPSGKNIYPEELESIFNKSDYVLESLVYQDQNQLTARVYLNDDMIRQEIESQNKNESEVTDYIRKKLEDLRHFVNTNTAGFSRITKIIEQTEPFEKTPTQKIKRYLYTG